MAPQMIAGQAVGLAALLLCIAGFASRQDRRLLVILIFANVAFALQFALFGAWTAAGISALVILRILVAIRMPGNRIAMLVLLAASLGVAHVTWAGPTDIFPLAAGLLGTYAMFMLRGIPMRLGLAGCAVLWAVTNALSGSMGALAAEVLVLATNLFTIARLLRDRKGQVSAPAV